MIEIIEAHDCDLKTLAGLAVLFQLDLIRECGHELFALRIGHDLERDARLLRFAFRLRLSGLLDLCGQEIFCFDRCLQESDFVFREEDEDGNEIISIMFEMKNEGDTNSVKKKNEDHFAKLDKDRTKKGCEYAILVSLLEPESELYNEGIVDVSHRYPKMYVVRPQFFIPIISLLRNAAISSLEYKRELALIRQQDLDVTTFENDLDTFKQGFFKNFKDASLRFEDAVKAIDKAIADLQKAKDKLLTSEKHLSAANNKLEDLTVKKLTRKNPTMKAKFEALKSEGDSKGAK